MDEITSKLGYRLVLTSGAFGSAVPPGGALPFHIEFDNEGYASPINRKRVQLVLWDTSANTLCAATLDSDVRTWTPGSHAIDATALLPPDIPDGSYELFLNIADTAESLKTSLDYKIKVANQILNQADTGLISLQWNVDVATSNSSPTASGSQVDVVCGVSEDILPPLISTIENGSFETSYGWGAFENGYDFVTSEAHSGTRSIVAYNHGGAQQVVSKEISGGSTVTFGGCSKSVGASTGLAEDYSIYVDIYYTDGTYLWGQTVNFDGGTTDWVCKSNSFLVPADKTVQQMNVHALYRSDPLDGTVYYDDVYVFVN